MSKIIQMQEAFRSLQNLKQICSYNREMIDCPTRCLIHQEARIWLIESGRATVKIQEQKFAFHWKCCFNSSLADDRSNSST